MAQYTSEKLRLATYSNGATGKGIQKIDNFYYAATSENIEEIPLTTAGDWKTKIEALPDGKKFDETNKYLWNFERITYTEGSPVDTDRVMIAVYSKDGRGIKNVTEFYIISKELPTNLPTISNKGDWVKEGDGALPVPDAQAPYLWNYEIVEYTSGANTSSGPVCIGSYGNSITSVTEWYKATNTSEAPTEANGEDGGWVTDINDAGQGAANPYLWNYEETTYSIENPFITPITLLTSSPREVVEIIEYYQQLPSTSEAPNGVIWQDEDDNHNLEPKASDGWGTTQGNLTPGNIMWNMEVIQYAAVDGEGKNLYTVTAPAQVGYAGTNGTSPYTISLDEDFCSIPADHEGNIDSNWTATISPTVFYGYTEQTWTNNATTGLGIFTTGINLTVNYNSSNKKYVVSYLTDSVGSVEFVLKKDNVKVAEAKFEAVKQRAGANGEYVYAKVSPNILHRNNITNINIELYKRSGSGQPQLSTDTVYYSYKIDSGNESTPVSFPGSTELSKDSLTNLNQLLQINIYTDSNKTTIVDKITINVLDDGKSDYYLYHNASTSIPDKPANKNYNDYPSSIDSGDGWYKIQTENSVYSSHKIATSATQSDIEWGPVTRMSGVLTNYGDLWAALDEKSTADNTYGGIYTIEDGKEKYIGINANLIQTGALSIGGHPNFDDDGNITSINNNVFYADTDNEKVFAGGWELSQESISSLDGQVELVSKITEEEYDCFRTSNILELNWLNEEFGNYDIEIYKNNNEKIKNIAELKKLQEYEIKTDSQADKIRFIPIIANDSSTIYFGGYFLSFCFERKSGGYCKNFIVDFTNNNYKDKIQYSTGVAYQQLTTEAGEEKDLIECYINVSFDSIEYMPATAISGIKPIVPYLSLKYSATFSPSENTKTGFSFTNHGAAYAAKLEIPNATLDKKGITFLSEKINSSVGLVEGKTKFYEVSESIPIENISKNGNDIIVNYNTSLTIFSYSRLYVTESQYFKISAYGGGSLLGQVILQPEQYSYNDETGQFTINDTNGISLGNIPDDSNIQLELTQSYIDEFPLYREEEKRIKNEPYYLTSDKGLFAKQVKTSKYKIIDTSTGEELPGITTDIEIINYDLIPFNLHFVGGILVGYEQSEEI